jgi:uncharacterized protein YbjQ (UPF0145 family)
MASEEEQRAEASLRALESGGIPLAAQERLDELRRSGGRFFTSDLTANEALLVQGAGFRPVTQVMGSCFYNIGWQWMPAGSSWSSWGVTYSQGQTVELEMQTEAWNEARRLALARLAEEARRAGAHAVVGVRVQRGDYDWSSGLLEFTAAGTAVVSDRYELGDEPVLSNLTGQQFAALFQHGYWPVGLVAATTVAYVMTGWRQQTGATGMFSRWQNQELADFTQGVYATRVQTMQRLVRQAHELGAHGVVGLELQRGQEEHEREANNVRYRDMILTMHVIGTAIAELAGVREEPPVFIGLPLDEERQ